MAALGVLAWVAPVAVADPVIGAGIMDSSWQPMSASLEITFASEPGRLYDVFASDDLQSFSWLFAVEGAADSVSTTVQGPSEGLPQRFFAVQSKPAAPAASWFASHNATREESHGHYILCCSDGGYLQVGEAGFIPDSARMLVVKTDAAGNLAWAREFGSSGHNLGNAAFEVVDGYLVCGALGQDSAILKLNKTTGGVIFNETCDNGGSDAFEHIALTDNGIVAVGYVQAEDPGNTFFTAGRGYLTFLDNNGNTTGGQSLNAYLAQAYRIKRVGNDYIVSGLTQEALDYAVLKIDASGTVLWNKTFGGTNADHCFGMDVADDGSIFLTGHTLSGTQNWDTYTMKLDAGGTLLWEKKVGNPRGFNPQFIHDESWGIKATCDGGCVISAGTGDEYSYSACIGGACSDQWEAYLVKFDAAGNVQWEQTYVGTDGYDWAAEDIDLTPDGGAIIAVDNGMFGFLKLAPFQTPALP